MQQTGTRFCFRCGFVSTTGETVCPEDGSPMSVAGIDPFIGKTLAGKYEVIELLGRGGMSVVYKVRHLFMHRLEALKLMRSELGSDNDALQRFHQESKAVAALRHVNVVTVLDFGVLDDGNPFLTMEFLEGQDLGDLIEKETFLSPERAIPLFAQICAGLHHAHSRGVIHRDMKPSNILITTANGVDLPIIVDFGIAKLLHADGSTMNKLTTTGQVFGSPLYMSPEQCNSQRIDERTDVYALGCVFYHALTGVPPILGNSPLETMMRQMTERARPFSAVKPDHSVNPEIEKVILKALAKNPDERFANMNELRQALLKAANMPITDLTSGSYIQSSGITPGIGTASGINDKVPNKAPSSDVVSTSDSSTSSIADSQEISESQPVRPRQKLFPTQETTSERLVVEPSYQGLLRRPAVQIGLSLVVILFIGLISTLAFQPPHNGTNSDDSIERTGANGERSHRRRGYADDDLAKRAQPDLIAAAVPPASPTPESFGSALSPSSNSTGLAGSSSYAVNPTRLQYADARSGMSTVTRSKAAMSRLNSDLPQLIFSRGRLSGNWLYGDEDLVGELSRSLPGAASSSDGVVYLICFAESAKDADFAAVANRAASALESRKIAVGATTALRRTDGLPIYMQEIKYAGKSPRSSFVLYYNSEQRVDALHVVPGKKSDQETREWIEKEIIPMFRVFKPS